MNNYARWIVLVLGVTGVPARLSVVVDLNIAHSKLQPTLYTLANNAHMLIINRMSPHVIPIYVLWIALVHGPIMGPAVWHVAVVCQSVHSLSRHHAWVLVNTVTPPMDKLIRTHATPMRAL